MTYYAKLQVTATKQILSNSSTLPLHKGKKIKTFTLPNRFAVLTLNDTSDGLFDAPLDTHNGIVVNLSHKVEEPAPPVFIKHITNFSAFYDVLTTSPSGFTCKSTLSYNIIRSNVLKNYKKNR